MDLYCNRLMLIILVLFFSSCQVEDAEKPPLSFEESYVAAFYNYYDGLTNNLSVYIEFLDYMDNIQSITGEIQYTDSILYEFELAPLELNPKVFIYDEILLDENYETILDSNIYLYDMVINILFIDSTNYSFKKDLSSPVIPEIINYTLPSVFQLDSTDWKELSIDLEIKDLNGINNIESVKYEIKRNLFACNEDCIIDELCNEEIIDNEYLDDDTWIFDYVDSSSDSTYIYNEIIFMRPLDGSALYDSEGNLIYGASDCGRTGIVEFKFIVKDVDGLSHEVSEIIMEISE